MPFFFLKEEIGLILSKKIGWFNFFFKIFLLIHNYSFMKWFEFYLNSFKFILHKCAGKHIYFRQILFYFLTWSPFSSVLVEQRYSSFLCLKIIWFQQLRKMYMVLFSFFINCTFFTSELFFSNSSAESVIDPNQVNMVDGVA